MDLAAELAGSGNDAGAIDAYNSALDIDPENATAWYCLGVIYSRVNSLDDAVKAFEKSNMILPNHPPTLANLAYLLSESNPSIASQYARSAIVTISDDEKLSSIAEYTEPSEPKRIFVEARQIDEAKETIEEKDLIIGGETISNSYDDARNLTISGDHSGAVSIWKGLLEESPNSPEVWRGLGDALSSAGYADRANQCFKRADSIESAPDPEITNLEIEERDSTDDLLSAAEEVQATPIETASRGDLDDAIGWYNMGINLLGEGNNDEALSSFEKAIGGCPPSEIELKVKAQNGRGNALYNSGRYSESVVAYHTAIGMDPQSVTGRTLFNMGSSYAAVEMFDDAIKCFIQALERGLEKQETELCEKQISRCRLLSREQAKRQSRT